MKKLFVLLEIPRYCWKPGWDCSVLCWAIFHLKCIWSLKGDMSGPFFILHDVNFDWKYERTFPYYMILNQYMSQTFDKYTTFPPHHCIKCLISVLGRALFFYQDFHFDFLLQYSLSYCWEDRPVSKEKPRSIRCFFFIFVFFLTFGGWNFNHVAQKILIKRAFLRIFFFWDQLNFSLSGVFKRRAI